MSLGAFSPAARAAILESTQGRCAGCGTAGGVQLHHRAPRGMGSARRVAVGDPPNGVPLCVKCHVWAESYRTLAAGRGWLLPVPDPAVPWWAYGHGWRRWVEEGGCWLVEYVDAPDPA